MDAEQLEPAERGLEEALDERVAKFGVSLCGRHGPDATACGVLNC
jgi:hypothetical protein